MRVLFGDASLAQCYGDEAYAAERWGAEAANRYAYVLNFLTCIDAAGDLGRFAFLEARVANGAQPPRWIVPLASEWGLTLELAEGGDAVSVAEVGAN